MPVELAPIPRAAVSDAVFGRVVNEILSGRLSAGAALPSERELAMSFQVNRHAVREALKRVQQVGLVRISQGGKTRVLDWRGHAGLDALSALAAAGAVPALRILHDIAVMRRTVAADAARLCARGGSDDQLAKISAAAHAYPEPGAQGVVEADLMFWTAVIDGSGNLAYRLALNTLVAAFSDIGWQVIADLGAAAEFADRDAHITLADLLAARDAAGAHRHAENLLGRFVASLAAASKDSEDSKG
jgi:DNA-binding FadR family transcriptional regulator